LDKLAAVLSGIFGYSQQLKYGGGANVKKIAFSMVGLDVIHWELYNNAS